MPYDSCRAIPTSIRRFTLLTFTSSKKLEDFAIVSSFDFRLSETSVAWGQEAGILEQFCPVR